jgi:hypothetical protein
MIDNKRWALAPEGCFSAIWTFTTGCYGWAERVLVQQQYAQQGKAARGLAPRYIEKMSGLSRAQVTRLIALYTASGRVRVTVYRRRRFAQLYTRADIELPASVDEARETLSGPAARRILEREVSAWMDEALGQTPYSTGKLREFFEQGKPLPVAD